MPWRKKTILMKKILIKASLLKKQLASEYNIFKNNKKGIQDIFNDYCIYIHVMNKKRIKLFVLY